MLRILLLITSPPLGPEAGRAFTLAASLRSRGIAVGVVLLQDAVLAAVRPSALPEAAAVDALLADEIPLYVAEQDLTLRGFSASGLAAGAQAVTDRRIVDLAMADNTRAIGCL